MTKDQPAARLDRFRLSICLEQWFSTQTNTYTFTFGGTAHSTLSAGFAAGDSGKTVLLSPAGLILHVVPATSCSYGCKPYYLLHLLVILFSRLSDVHSDSSHLSNLMRDCLVLNQQFAWSVLLPFNNKTNEVFFFVFVVLQEF